MILVHLTSLLFIEQARLRNIGCIGAGNCAKQNRISSLAYGGLRKQRTPRHFCEASRSFVLRPCVIYEVSDLSCRLHIPAGSDLTGILEIQGKRLFDKRTRLAAYTLVDSKTSPSGEINPQFTAFLTSAAILVSAVFVNSVTAKTIGHRAPSSRFACSEKPTIMYRSL